MVNKKLWSNYLEEQYIIYDCFKKICKEKDLSKDATTEKISVVQKEIEMLKERLAFIVFKCNYGSWLSC